MTKLLSGLTIALLLCIWGYSSSQPNTGQIMAKFSQQGNYFLQVVGDNGELLNIPTDYKTYTASQKGQMIPQ
jgi:hypothetical protein